MVNINKGNLCQSVEELERELLSGRYDKHILKAVRIFAKKHGLEAELSTQEFLETFKNDKDIRNELIEYFMERIPKLKNRELWEQYLKQNEIDTTTSLVNKDLSKLLDSKNNQASPLIELLDTQNISSEKIQKIIDTFNEIYPEHITQSALNDLLREIDGKPGAEKIQKELLTTKAVKNLVFDYWFQRQSFIGNDTHAVIDKAVNGNIDRDDNFFLKKYYKMYQKVIHDMVAEIKEVANSNPNYKIHEHPNHTYSVELPGGIPDKNGKIIARNIKTFKTLEEAEAFVSSKK